ncbi:MAG: alpha/beta hydrolase [Candidatus Dormibacteria bacterium]
MSRRTLAVATASLLAFSACSSVRPQAARPKVSPSATASPTPSPSPSPSQLPQPPPLSWQSCNGTFQCATLQVPLDYGASGGESIGVAMIRLPARNQANRIGSLLTDPGGPGASGIGFVLAAAQKRLDAYRERFDIVGFDPRGAGRSRPVQCLDGPGTERFLELDPVPDDAAERQALIDANKQYVAACQAHGGNLLGHLAAETVAMDMEEMRIALGDSALTYMGLSYGSLLGETYAELFPGRVRAIDLDGVVDPNLGLDGFIHDQAVAYDDALVRFLAACTGGACSFNADGRGRQKLLALTASIDRHPLAVGARSIGPGGLSYAVAEGVTSPRNWNHLGESLNLAANGDGRGLLFFFDSYAQRGADGTYSNLFDIYNAVICTDRQSPSIEALDSLAADLKGSAPYFGAATVYQSLPCLYWPVPATGRPHPVRAHGAPPILVVGGTHDPATPYSWATAVAGELESGVLLTRDGDGHVSLGRLPCIDDAVSAYLIDLKVPPPNTVCR